MEEEINAIKMMRNAKKEVLATAGTLHARIANMQSEATTHMEMAILRTKRMNKLEKQTRSL